MLSSAPPPITPLDRSPARPRFSVMLPTHEPDGMLVQALQSVLRQAWATEDMQIAVVDDRSRPGRVAELVARVDTEGRVEIHEHRDRLGLCGNWNRAISLARGDLVHLLHQDDYVLPGFYERMNLGFSRAPDCGMAFCRTRLVDAEDRLLKIFSRQQWRPGVLANWLPRIAQRQRIQTPSVVVPRRTYETLGGYRPDLQLALDWEMWVRIAAASPVWYEPQPLASYRRHAANETARLTASGAVWPDMARAIEFNACSLPPHSRDRILTASVRWYAASAIRTAKRQIRAGAFGRAAVTLGQVPQILELIGEVPRSETCFRRLANLQQQVSHRIQLHPA